jgi:hypothetical protein
MNRILAIILLSLLPIGLLHSDAPGQKTHPITFSLKKNVDGKYDLQMDLPPDYGFQKDAPHRILLSGKGTLVVKKADLTFVGPSHPKKSEYFEYVKAMPLTLEGVGELELNAKIFYCNFKKNICIPGKVSEILSVP